MNEIDVKEIRQRAYSLWDARGRPEGSADKDWFDAENQLKAELKGAALESTLQTLRDEGETRPRRSSKSARSTDSSRRSADASGRGVDSSGRGADSARSRLDPSA